MIFGINCSMMPKSYSIQSIEDKKGSIKYWIISNRGGFLLDKKRVNEIIKNIQQTSKEIDEEYIGYYNKVRLLYVDENDFLEKYGENDPVWQKYGKDLIEERNQARERNPIKGHIYFLKCTDTSLCKIGYSSSVKKRIKNIQNASPTQIRLIGILESNDCEVDERYYKNMFADKNVKGEWFALDETDLIDIGVMENE